MEVLRFAFDVLAGIILAVSFLGLLLKRDKQDRYLLWTLLIAPLAIIYLVIAPEFASDRAPALAPFEQRVLIYQVVALALAFGTKIDNNAGSVCFWLATFLNIGTGATLIYYARFWSM